VTCGICSAGSFHPCFPENCGSGGGPWKTKGADGVAVINYFFDSNVDQERRNTFVTATQWWSSKVCVRFQESTAQPAMQVGIYDQQSCSAYVGYPGPNAYNKVNMGWCKSQAAVGHLAHEIGHALGMNHEQQRPDAGTHYYTPAGWKGPYINIHWGGIDPNWKPQYEPSDLNYIGSSERGYAEYDFESVMHYPEDGKNFNTVNPIYDKVVGNRDHLSAGDIKRASDMYQCSSPSPSSPAFTITTRVDGNNKKCLDLPGGDSTPGNKLQLWDCNGNSNQRWIFGSGSWSIQYANDPSKCIDISGGLMQDGTPLQIWGCNGAADQKWGYDATKGTIYAASSADASLCMDLPGSSLNDGTNLQVWGCNGHRNQQWALWNALMISNGSNTAEASLLV